jgi:hypothetical protein
MDGELKLQSWHFGKYQEAFNKWVLTESKMCSSEQGTLSETAIMNKEKTAHVQHTVYINLQANLHP